MNDKTRLENLTAQRALAEHRVCVAPEDDRPYAAIALALGIGIQKTVEVAKVAEGQDNKVDI